MQKVHLKSSLLYFVLTFFLLPNISQAQEFDVSKKDVKHQTKAVKFGLSASHGLNIGIRIPSNKNFAIELCLGKYLDILGYSSYAFGPTLSYSVKKTTKGKVDLLLVSSLIVAKSSEPVMIIAPTIGLDTYTWGKTFFILRLGYGAFISRDPSVQFIPNLEIGFAFDLVKS